MEFAVSFDDITAAAGRIKGLAVETPLLENTLLNEQVGGRVLLKAETLQRVGAFKFRGAYNRLSQLSDEEKKKGVVAWSSGNHAQGVAAAAGILGIDATIIMPKDSPKIKVDNTRGYGATIHFYDRYSENREEIGYRMSRETGATLVPSYDDPHIIAGQGTTGLELVTQADALGVELDAVFVPCGGGGLCAGTSMAVRTQKPAVKFYAVEPEDFDDTARSFASGKQERIDPTKKSICDALLTAYPGDLTFPIMRKYVDQVLTISDDEARMAVKYAWEKLKLVVEPGGSAGLAAVLAGKLDCKGKTIAIVLSGGNVDSAMFEECLNR